MRCSYVQREERLMHDFSKWENFPFLPCSSQKCFLWETYSASKLVAVKFQSISGDFTTYSKLKTSRIFIQKNPWWRLLCRDYFCLILLLSIILANNWCKQEGKEMCLLWPVWLICLVSAVEICCINFMSELSKHKLSSQLTFPLPIALTSSHDKHCHCVAWALPSPFQWKRIPYVTLAHLLCSVSLVSEISVDGGRTPLASWWWHARLTSN